MPAPSPFQQNAHIGGPPVVRSPRPAGTPTPVPPVGRSNSPFTSAHGMIKEEPFADETNGAGLGAGDGFGDMMLPDPQSPRESMSPPPPDGALGDCETEIVALHQALYELGCSLFETKAGSRPNIPPKVNQVVEHLAQIERIAQHVDAGVPFQVLEDVDQARNPHNVTADRIERTATENQFMHGKIAAIEGYRAELEAALREHFPLGGA